jgi:hypothetical protein
MTTDYWHLSGPFFTLLLQLQAELHGLLGILCVIGA